MQPTKKHRVFVQKRMGHKPVTVVPGIGRVTGNNLKRKSDIIDASTLYGRYLVGKKTLRTLSWSTEGMHEASKLPTMGWRDGKSKINRKRLKLSKL